jgi:hypothetical protein
LDYLDLASLYNFGKAWKSGARLVFPYSLAEKKNVMCFQTKLHSDEAILGVGVNFTKHDDG